MENNYFIYTDKIQPLTIEKFHICSWEFINGSSLIEFGGEISYSDIFQNDELLLNLYIPWISKDDKVTDLYDSLKEPENCKFIFNDSVTGNKFLDRGERKDGVIQEFVEREPLCIMPFFSETIVIDNILTIKINLKPYKTIKSEKHPNIYFRFYLEPAISNISTRKSGISRSTIIYDIKINEKRNLPSNSSINLNEHKLCEIKNCFCFNILPNSYDLTFFDTAALKNIRTLEFKSFKKYIKDKRVKKDELVVVFNKKRGEESYSFFSIYSKERIGAGQFALAVFVNLVCGILLFIPSYKTQKSVSLLSKTFWNELPLEVYISISIGIILLVYFLWPKIILPIRQLIKKLF